MFAGVCANVYGCVWACMGLHVRIPWRTSMFMCVCLLVCVWPFGTPGNTGPYSLG